jgi:hypothetical protein
MEGFSFEVKAHIHKASRLKDRTISLTFYTEQEIDSPTFLAIDQNVREEMSGTLIFVPNDIQTPKIDVMKGKDVFRKSPSQRLHGAIWGWWKRLDEKKETSLDNESFYLEKIEKYISHANNQARY